VWVDILNPYNDKEFLTDKLSIVDIKARDGHEHLYQIEIQLCSYAHLPARILYNWTDIYSQQLQSGQDYRELKPTYAIWLLAENLLTDDGHYWHHYKMRDQLGKTLCQKGGIWLLELNKFETGRIDTEQERWLKFFKEGETLNDAALPDWMSTKEMKQAMSTLTIFSEKDRQYHQYQARQEYLREQRTMQFELEESKQAAQSIALELNQERQERLAAEQHAESAKQRAEAEKQRAEAEKQRAEAEKQRAEAAIAENEHLKRLLANRES